MKILVIEDDAQAAAYMAKGLKEAGHVVDVAPDGTQGLFLAGSEHYDVLVVDRMLPGRDGLSLIGLLRATGNDTPALVLSALGSVEDRVKGLRAGGDDYLTKPYAFSELLARVEVLARRSSPSEAETSFQVAGLHLDRLSRKVE
ncbi:MAG TPA: response regulator, partial [Azospirillaceae bacterium]|nr:response regulator [Azospirillaceae bacterium]